MKDLSRQVRIETGPFTHTYIHTHSTYIHKHSSHIHTYIRKVRELIRSRIRTRLAPLKGDTYCFIHTYTHPNYHYHTYIHTYIHPNYHYHIIHTFIHTYLVYNNIKYRNVATLWNECLQSFKADWSPYR